MTEYTSREFRHKFIAEKFGTYLIGSVLNIGGGGKKHLLKYIHPKKYIELDIDGKPDLIINLEKEYPLPIESNSFDTVLCTDVLEHLEEFHRVFEELIRISNKYVIISVPNGIFAARAIFRQLVYVGDSGKSGFDVGAYSKYYGLPQKKPKDRHRWFFSYTEAEKFFNNNQKNLDYSIVEKYPIDTFNGSIKNHAIRLFLKYFLGKDALKDWFYSVYWCVIEK